MRNFILPGLLVASTLVSAGCGQSPESLGALGTQGPGEQTQSLTPLGGTTLRRDPRIMPMHRPGEAPLIKTAPLAKLQYYGGHVLSSVKIVPVYWGTGTMISATDMHGFYAAVVSSSYLDWLSEYDTNITAVGGSHGTDQHIGRGSIDAKDYTITPSHTSKALSDDDVQAELSHQIDIHAVPAPDADTIYMIHFPLHTSIDLGGSGSCSAFCAYHSTLSKSGQSVYYSVLPYMGAGSGCEGGCGSAAKDLDNQSSVSSHELVEAITDGEIGLVAGTIGAPAAWYDSANGEIGDICNAEQGVLAGTPYTIQLEWSNKAGKCQATAGTCTPSCSGKSCGPDGCGGTCGTCAAGQTCDGTGTCVGGGGSTCAHDKCTSGKKLSSGCDPCVTKICDADAFCCGSKWDSTCVGEVSAICGESC